MNVPQTVIQVCHKLDKAGFQAWLVGGAVRDSIILKLIQKKIY
jgi:tRNA nucleotidyltransferase/poly(A) polymerase